MTTAADALHASVFGRHAHPCPSEWCKGAQRSCSDPYDCQLGPKLCGNCAFIEEENSYQRAMWRQVDKILQTGVKAIRSEDAGA